MPLHAFSDFHDIAIDYAGQGLTESLAARESLLLKLLSRAICAEAGESVYSLFREVIETCLTSGPEADACDAVGKRLATLSVDDLQWLLRGLAAYFHLVNRSEQQEIARINRERSRQATREAPRAESVAAAVHALSEAGYGLDEVLTLLARIDLQPTLTAHPTEARRSSILRKQDAIAELVDAFYDPQSTPNWRDGALRQIYQQITLLLGTRETRRDRMTVDQEVSHGLFFLTHSIWETVPRLYWDLRRALHLYYGADRHELPTMLTYRSWIGGDRDGNPLVTAEVTRATLRRHREAVLQLYLTELVELRHDLSLSSSLVPVTDELRESIDADLAVLEGAGIATRAKEDEPFRLKLDCMRARLEAQLADSPAVGYCAGAFIADLAIMRRGLGESISGKLGRCDRLDDLTCRARTFGFHLATLDIRQHSQVHGAAIDELLRLAGSHPGYLGLTEEARCELLIAELSNPRPLLPRRASPGEATRELLAVFQVIREAVERDPRAIQAYVISMTHEVSHVLEVLVLAKEVGLWSADGETNCPLDIVPLFETIDDLERAESLMQRLFDLPVYRRHLTGRGNFQEIMLGYSDSNKDGGYWAANWALHQAQATLCRVCQRNGIEVRLFHGRGGTVGRGGGRANAAILAMPVEARSGRIRFTEQGEVITFRYALPEIARRHTEQIVHALLRADLRRRTAVERDLPSWEEAKDLMESLARDSMAAYRAFIDDRGFWPWYTSTTPIEYISRLRIASRPVSRGAAHEVDFERLRAIPWVFAWTQTRYNLPGWFGLGSALAPATDNPGSLQRLRTWYCVWPFFRTVLDNAELELARSRLVIAERYGDGESPLAKRIRQEYALACAAILRIAEADELLARVPVLRQSIAVRNPFTDVLNLAQIELLRRVREADEADDELLQAIFLSINGIAAAMQSTG